MIGDNPNIQTGASVERGRLAGEPVPAQQPQERREVQTSTEVVASTSTAFAICGAGGLALGILALVGVLPTFLGPIGAIVLGAGLLIEAGGVAARYRALVDETHGDYGTITLGGGLGADAIGGAAAIVLGILALVRLAPTTLLACAVIALGASLMIGTTAMIRLNNIAIRHAGAHPKTQEAAREAVTASANAQALVGAGAIALGILSLVGVAPVVLNQVAVLSIGAGILIAGSALASRMSSMFVH